MFKCLGLLQMFKENLCFQSIDPDGSRRLAPRLQVFNSWNHSPGFNSLENLKYKKKLKYQVQPAFNPLCWQIVDQTHGAAFNFSRIWILEISFVGNKHSRFNFHIAFKGSSGKMGFSRISWWLFFWFILISLIGNKHSRFNFHVGLGSSHLANWDFLEFHDEVQIAPFHRIGDDLPINVLTCCMSSYVFSDCLHWIMNSYIGCTWVENGCRLRAPV